MEKVSQFANIPQNDIIMRIAEYISEETWVLLFVGLNYLVIVLLMIIYRRKLQTFAKDFYYHILWLGLIPLGYMLLLPEAYQALTGSLRDIGNIVIIPDPKPYLDRIEDFRGSPVVSVVTAIGIIPCVFGWTRVFRLSSKKQIDYWWYSKQRFTPAGVFFLAMCTLVAWSFLLFFVNAFYGEHIFLKAISQATELVKFTVSATGEIKQLKAFQDLITWILGLWSVVTVGVVLLGYSRRKEKVTKKRDRLLLINAIVAATFLLALFVYPVYFLHGILVEIGGVPTWPISLGMIFTAGPNILGVGVGLVAGIERLLGK